MKMVELDEKKMKQIENPHLFQQLAEQLIAQKEIERRNLCEKNANIKPERETKK